MSQSFTLEDVERWIKEKRDAMKILDTEIMGLEAIKSQLQIESHVAQESQTVVVGDAALQGEFDALSFRVPSTGNTLLDFCLEVLEHNSGTWFTSTALADRMIQIGMKDEEKPVLASKITTALKKYRHSPPEGIEVKHVKNKYLFRSTP